MGWRADRILVYRKPPPTPQAPPPGSLRHKLAIMREAFIEGANEKELARRRQRIRVGIWDLDSRAGQLPALLEEVEAVQDKFSFYSAEAPLQSGLTAPGPHVARQWKARTGIEMSEADAHANVLAAPLFRAGQRALEGLDVQWLVMLLRARLADDGGSEAHVDLLSTMQGRVVLVSTDDLRLLAHKAQRPFETAVLAIALSALLMAMVPELEFQNETTGSIFDYCENRDDLVAGLRALEIDNANRARIPAPLLEAVEHVLDFLRTQQAPTPKMLPPPDAERSMPMAAGAAPDEPTVLGTAVLDLTAEEKARLENERLVAAAMESMEKLLRAQAGPVSGTGLPTAEELRSVAGRSRRAKGATSRILTGETTDGD